VSEWFFGLMPYGAPWRAHRKFFHEVLNVGAIGRFESHQCKHVHRFLSRLLEEPKHFIRELDL